MTTPLKKLQEEKGKLFDSMFELDDYGKSHVVQEKVKRFLLYSIKEAYELGKCEKFEEMVISMNEGAEQHVLQKQRKEIIEMVREMEVEPHTSSYNVAIENIIHKLESSHLTEQK